MNKLSINHSKSSGPNHLMPKKKTLFVNVFWIFFSLKGNMIG